MQSPLEGILSHITKKKVLPTGNYYRTALTNNIKKSDDNKSVYTITNMLNYTQ